MEGAADWIERRLHFVGIGGDGMSGLAAVCQALGARVSGSDGVERAALGGLRAQGITLSVGHEPDNVPADAELVYSSAIRPENPERMRARELGLRELRRGELLGELARLRRCIAVAGTHGKTTTSAMTFQALRGAGERPSCVIGAEILDIGASWTWDEGEWLVVESDESDRTLLSTTPEIAILTNVELDHTREYGSRLELYEVFRAFLSGAALAVIWDRPELVALRDGPCECFEVEGLRLEAGGSRFRWREHEVRLRVPGAHNARNAVAALEACRLTGADLGLAIAALADYGGTRHRLQAIGETSRGARLYDDYAHHPTAVSATLQAARTFGPRRLVAVLEPHLYTTSRLMAREFGEALSHADVVVVLEIYGGSESAERYPGISGRPIAQASADWAGGGAVAWLPSLEDAERFLRAELRTGDICVTLGIGPIQDLATRLLA